MKIRKLRIIIALAVFFLFVLSIGGANRVGYCIPEFRQLHDDELYERGMRNYMNFLVGPQNLGLKNNLPVSKKDPDRAIYPDMGGSKGFHYPIWIFDEKITEKEFNKRIYAYGKTDVDRQDRKRFDKIIKFLNVRTVTDGLSATLKFFLNNNNFSFMPMMGSYVHFYSYNCCYIGGRDEMKKYNSPYPYIPEKNLYNEYVEEPSIQKPWWKPYTGWNERFLIMKEGNAVAGVQRINGREKNRMDIEYNNIVFFPISNCGKIDNKYGLKQLIEIIK